MQKMTASVNSRIHDWPGLTLFHNISRTRGAELPEISHTSYRSILRGLLLKDYIEECAINIANYIVDHNATVRQAAKEFDVSKSTVHMIVIK